MRYAATGEMPESQYAALERAFARKAEDLLHGFIVELGSLSTEDLLGIAEYRDAIQPSGWMQKCIREYVSVWRGAA